VETTARELESVARELAVLLLRSEAIRFRPEGWTLSSGRWSPMYVDLKGFAYSWEHFQQGSLLLSRFLFLVNGETFQCPPVIASVATGAIQWGSVLAARCGKGHVIVRPQPKAHGLQRAVEADLSGVDVLLFEDVVTTGKSVLDSLKALKEAGANVVQLISFFTYNVARVEGLSSLLTLDDLLVWAVEEGFLLPEKPGAILKWRKDEFNAQVC